MNRNTCLTTLCLFVLSFVNAADASTMSMSMLDFSNQTPNAPSWTVDWGEINNTATISFSTTMSGDNNHWSRAKIDFTNPAFEAEFGDVGSFMSLNRPDPVGSGGMTEADIHFDNPLPAGSILLVLDVDAKDEVLALQSSNRSLGLPMMMETMSGETSTFAAWDNSAAQTLTTVSNGPNNDREAYYWDVSGMQDFHLEYTTHAGSAQVGFLTAVPEPSTASLCVMVSLIIVLAGRRREC